MPLPLSSLQTVNVPMAKLTQSLHLIPRLDQHHQAAVEQFAQAKNKMAAAGNPVEDDVPANQLFRLPVRIEAKVNFRVHRLIQFCQKVIKNR